MRIISIWRPADALIHKNSQALLPLVTYLDPENPDAKSKDDKDLLPSHTDSKSESLHSTLSDADESAALQEKTIQTLAGVVRRYNIAHLHVHYLGHPATLASLVSQLTNITFSISAHAKDVYQTAPNQTRQRLKEATFITTCTQYNVDYLRTIAPVQQAKIQLINHGIDTTHFCPSKQPKMTGQSDEPPVILSIGRFKFKKGLDLLIDACELLRAQGTNFECKIVGYGDQEDCLRKQISKKSLEDQIRIYPPVTENGVRDLLNNTTIFVLPCRIGSDGDRDGIPNAVLEAMACGLPVISTTVSGIPEIVHSSINGLLVEPDNPTLIAEAITKVITDKALAQRLGKAARHTICERFDWKTNLRPLTDVLKKAVALSNNLSVTR
ncbi:MAG: glycosyltransferase family 4 protein [Burkholderiaceae bacterium]